VAYFPLGDITDGVLRPSSHTTRHADLGATTWYTVEAGGQSKWTVPDLVDTRS
jgi:uncharacterized protein (DUF427 family)